MHLSPPGPDGDSRPEQGDDGAVDPPTWRSGRGFWTAREPGAPHRVLWWRDGEGVRRRLVDPAALDPTDAAALGAWSPSPDGTLLAWSLHAGPDDDGLLRVLEVAGREQVDGPLGGAARLPVAWLPDGPAFCWVRRLPRGDRVLRHEVGAEVRGDATVWGGGRVHGCVLSPDGRRLVVTAALGGAGGRQALLLDLVGGAAPVPVHEGACVPSFGPDGLLWLLTGDGGRLVRVRPERPPDRVTVLADEQGTRLAQVAVLPGALVVVRTRSGVAGLAVHELDGRLRTAVDLPGAGVVTGLGWDPAGGRDVWVGWASPTSPPQVLRLDTGTGALRRWQAPSRSEVS